MIIVNDTEKYSLRGAVATKHPLPTLPPRGGALHALDTGGMKISCNNNKLSPPPSMGEGEGGGGQKGLFSPSPQSPPVEEGNQLKSNQIFIIALQGIVKTYYRPPCLKCVLRPAPRGGGRGWGGLPRLRAVTPSCTNAPM